MASTLAKLQSNNNNNHFLDICMIPGVDYQGEPISDFAVSNERECAQNCQGISFCGAFSYSKQQSRCWLKYINSDGPAVPVVDDDKISGVIRTQCNQLYLLFQKPISD